MKGVTQSNRQECGHNRVVTLSITISKQHMMLTLWFNKAQLILVQIWTWWRSYSDCYTRTTSSWGWNWKVVFKHNAIGSRCQHDPHRNNTNLQCIRKPHSWNFGWYWCTCPACSSYEHNWSFCRIMEECSGSWPVISIICSAIKQNITNPSPAHTLICCETNSAFYGIGKGNMLEIRSKFKECSKLSEIRMRLKKNFLSNAIPLWFSSVTVKKVNLC